MCSLCAATTPVATDEPVTGRRLSISLGRHGSCRASRGRQGPDGEKLAKPLSRASSWLQKRCPRFLAEGERVPERANDGPGIATPQRMMVSRPSSDQFDLRKCHGELSFRSFAMLSTNDKK